MKIDINRLNETEFTAITSRVRQRQGEEVSTIPYTMACVAELADIFRTFTPEQCAALMRVRNEFLFLRIYLDEMISKASVYQPPVSAMSDEDAVSKGLSLAAMDGLFEILLTLQNAADARLAESMPNGYKYVDVGGKDDKLN